MYLFGFHYKHSQNYEREAFVYVDRGKVRKLWKAACKLQVGARKLRVTARRLRDGALKL